MNGPQCGSTTASTDCLVSLGKPRLFAISTRGARHHTEPFFARGDAFLLGPESSGLPADLLAALSAEQVLRIPMRTGARSLNLSNAAAVVVYEAWRQLRASPESASRRELLRLQGPRHQRHDGLLWRDVLFQHPVDLLADRHLQLEPLRPRPARRSRRTGPRPPGRCSAPHPTRSGPAAIARPKRRLRDWSSVQVSTRSPMPDRPMNVAAPATERNARAGSSRPGPRVISAMRVLAPKPRPSEMPAPMASTFFTAPPTSTPIMSSEV